MSLSTTKLKQVVVYVEEDLYNEFKEIAESDRRLSLSYLGLTAIQHGWDAAKRQLAPSFSKPTQDAHGRRKRAA